MIIHITGCASFPMPDKGPFYVSGIPISMENTDWYTDFCTYDQPVNSNVIGFLDSCDENSSIALHPYIHKVKIVNLRDKFNKPYMGSITFAMTGPSRIDFIPTNKNRWEFIIQPSPSDLRQDTDIKYVGIPAQYRAAQDCIYSYEDFHTDYRNCKDLDFHQKYKGQCLSIEQINAHYRE